MALDNSKVGVAVAATLAFIAVHAHQLAHVARRCQHPVRRQFRTLDGARHGPRPGARDRESGASARDRRGHAARGLDKLWYDAISTSSSLVKYKRSADNGLTWGADVTLSPSTPGILDGDPYLAACGTFVHVVYWRNPYNTLNGLLPATEILYRRSPDEGVTWDSELVLSVNDTFWAGLACSGSHVYVTYQNAVNATNTEVFFQASTNNGDTFGVVRRISHANGRSEDPGMFAQGSTIFIVWNDNRADLQHLEFFYIRSTDYGATWGPETALTSYPPDETYSPFVIANGDNVVCLCMMEGIFSTMRSSDGGVSFSPLVAVSTVSYVGYPTAAFDGNGALHVVFAEIAQSGVAYYVNSTDAGATWSAPVTIASWSASNTGSATAYIAASGEMLHVVYAMTPTGVTAPIGLYYTNNAKALSGTKAVSVFRGTRRRSLKLTLHALI